MTIDLLLVIMVVAPVDLLLLHQAINKYIFGRVRVWASYNFANESPLSYRNQFSDVWNVLKHVSHFHYLFFCL